MAIRLAFIVEAKDNVDIVVKYDEVLNILTIEQDDAWITVPADVVEDLRQALSEQASDLEEHRFETQKQPLVSFSPTMRCGAIRKAGDLEIWNDGSEHAHPSNWYIYPCELVTNHPGVHRDAIAAAWIDKENAE